MTAYRRCWRAKPEIKEALFRTVKEESARVAGLLAALYDRGGVRAFAGLRREESVVGLGGRDVLSSGGPVEVGQHVHQGPAGVSNQAAEIPFGQSGTRPVVVVDAGDYVCGRGRGVGVGGEEANRFVHGSRSTQSRRRGPWTANPHAGRPLCAVQR